MSYEKHNDEYLVPYMGSDRQTFQFLEMFVQYEESRNNKYGMYLMKLEDDVRRLIRKNKK